MDLVLVLGLSHSNLTIRLTKIAYRTVDYNRPTCSLYHI